MLYKLKLIIFIAISAIFVSSCGEDKANSKIKSKKSNLNIKGSIDKKNDLDDFGGNKFVEKLKAFNNSSSKDISNQYWGWNTNPNPSSIGDKNAIKGGMITILGDQEYPSTFRSVGKDSRSQILSLLDYLQYEPLLIYDYENLEWSPSLATHWKVSSDSLTYWYRLDPRAKWADGKELIAEDIISTFKLLIDAGHEDPNVSAFWGDSFETPIAKSKHIIEVTAKKKDWRTFRYFSGGLFVYPSTYLNKVDGAGFIEKYDFTFMPGTGPYEFDKEASKKGNEGYIVLKKRADWWAENEKVNQGLYNFDEIKFIFIEDENQQVISFFNGDYDIFPWSRAQWWVERFTDEKYKELKQGWVQKIKIFNYLPKGPSGIVFNTKKAPFDNVNIRKALSYMFDVDKLNKRLFFNEYVRLNTYFYGTPYANPNNPLISFSPKLALELLNKEGWVRKKGEKWLTKNNQIFEFEFLIAPGDDRIYTTLQEDLKNIGVKMEFKQVDYSAKFSTVMKKEYEVTSQGWTANFFPSPESTMHSKYADEVEVTNITSMANPELDKLIEQYNAEWSAKKRIKYAHQIDSIAVNMFHYGLGWTSPYGARMLYWNKFGIPESGVSYIGDWRSPISMWWINPDKNKNLIEAKKNNSKLKKENEIIDFWNRK